MKKFLSELFYPIKNVKILMVVCFSFYLIIGFLSITPQIATSIISNNYDYYNDNVLYDEFKLDKGVYSVSKVENMLLENGNKYSKILNNNLKDIGCSVTTTLKVNGASYYNFYFTNFFSEAFTVNSNCSVDLLFHNNEKGVYLTKQLFEKYNKPKNLTISFSDNVLVEIPIVGVYDVNDDSGMGTRIYCDYEYIVNFEKNEIAYEYDFSLVGIYIFDRKIDKIIDGTLSKYQLVYEEKRSFQIFFDMNMLYLNINIMIFILLFFVILLDKNFYVEKNTKILTIFYKNKVYCCFKKMINDSILVIISFLLSFLIVFISTMIINTIFNATIFIEFNYLYYLFLMIIIIVFSHLFFILIEKFYKKIKL